MSQDIPKKADSSMGWKWIEEKLGRKDQDEMKNHTDDIDTILLVDGLFSAVVTGFIVYSLDLLKEDTGESTAQRLTQILDRFNNISLRYVRPFINSTILPQDSTVNEQFKPTHAGRTINILWFTSITLSLASAVLGLLVKQWIRGYLTWKSPTADPRKNVLVRQLRIEHWECWGVPLVIAAIPALLEIAVALFVSGISVLLWKLDHYTFIPVTAIIGGFLSLLGFFLLTSLVFKHCAYRSPTGIALSLLWKYLLCIRLVYKCFIFPRSISHSISHLIYCAINSSKNSHQLGVPASPFGVHFRANHSAILAHSVEKDTWRSLDVQATRIHKLRNSQRRNYVSAPSALLDDLHWVTEGRLRAFLDQMPDSAATFEDLASVVAPVYAGALGETDTLFRALITTATELSDVDDLADNLAACAQTIQPQLSCLYHHHHSSLSGSPDSLLTELAIHSGFSTLIIWYLLSRVNVAGSAYMGSFYHHPRIIEHHLAANGGRLGFPPLWSGQVRMFRSIGDYIMCTLYQSDDAGDVDEPDVTMAAHTWVPPCSDRTRIQFVRRGLNFDSIIMGYILAISFREVVHVHARHLTMQDHPAPSDLSHVIALRMRNMVQALQWVIFYWGDETAQFRACRARCVDTLVDVFNFLSETKQKKAYDPLFPTLRRNIFTTLYNNTPHRIRFTSKASKPIPNCLYFEERPFHEVKNWAAETVELMTNIPITQNDGDSSFSDYHLLSELVCAAIAEISVLNKEQTKAMLETAANALATTAKEVEKDIVARSETQSKAETISAQSAAEAQAHADFVEAKSQQKSSTVQADPYATAMDAIAKAAQASAKAAKANANMVALNAHIFKASVPTAGAGTRAHSTLDNARAVLANAQAVHAMHRVHKLASMHTVEAAIPVARANVDATQYAFRTPDEVESAIEKAANARTAASKAAEAVKSANEGFDAAGRAASRVNDDAKAMQAHLEELSSREAEAYAAAFEEGAGAESITNVKDFSKDILQVKKARAWAKMACVNAIASMKVASANANAAQANAKAATANMKAATANATTASAIARAETMTVNMVQKYAKNLIGDADAEAAAATMTAAKANTDALQASADEAAAYASAMEVYAKGTRTDFDAYNTVETRKAASEAAMAIAEVAAANAKAAAANAEVAATAIKPCLAVGCSWTTVLNDIKSEWTDRLISFPNNGGTPPWVVASKRCPAALLDFIMRCLSDKTSTKVALGSIDELLSQAHSRKNEAYDAAKGSLIANNDGAERRASSWRYFLLWVQVQQLTKLSSEHVNINGLAARNRAAESIRPLMKTIVDDFQKDQTISFPNDRELQPHVPLELMERLQEIAPEEAAALESMLKSGL